MLQQETHQVHDEVQLNGEIHYEEDTGPGVPGIRWHHHVRETASEKDTSLGTKYLTLHFPLQRQEAQDTCVCVNSHPKICTFLQNVWLLMTQKFVPSNEQQEHGGMMKKINMKSTFLAHPENKMVKGDL